MCVCVCVCVHLLKPKGCCLLLEHPSTQTAFFYQLNIPRLVCVCCCRLPFPFLSFFIFSLKHWRFIKDRPRPGMTVPFMSLEKVQ